MNRSLLKEIQSWCATLASNLAWHNPELTDTQLNVALQLILERMIFLRLCEERGIEADGWLRSLRTGTRVYSRLCEIFRQADQRYPSGLFYCEPEAEQRAKGTRHYALCPWLFGLRPMPDVLTLRLTIDDQPLKRILEGLYSPEISDQFAASASKVLGQVYELFLGRVVRLTPDHGAIVEEKPEVKKSGGVYYTPAYIVDYIIQQTVGKLLEDKTPRQVAKLKIVDQSCGSGSFLLGAYQYLLDWHLAYYVTDGPEKHAEELYRGGGGDFRLTASERRRILLNNIYGVDIDPQAVEITKLSLLLKVLEGEQQHSLAIPPRFSPERILSDLSRNIKCGNSLLGSDFTCEQQPDWPAWNDEEPLFQSGAFDWDREFPDVVKAGGFDAVIGNPPYGARLPRQLRRYLARKFRAGTTETAALMMLQARKLSRPGGWNGLVVPKSFTYLSNWQQLREELLDELVELVDLGKVWKKVKLEQVIYLLRRGEAVPSYRSRRRKGEEMIHLAEIAKRDCRQFGFYLNAVTADELALGRRIARSSSFLSSFTRNTRGGMFQAMVGKRGEKRAIGGKQLQRYLIAGEKGWVAAGTDLPSQAFPQPGSILVQNIVAHLTRPVDHIKIIGTVVSEEEAEQIVILDTVNQLTNHSQLSSHYLLGLLLSRLINWYVYRFIFARAVRTMHFDSPVSNRIPIRTINFSDPADQTRYHRMVELVEMMLRLHKQLACGGDRRDQLRLRQQIETREQQLNHLAYELFELTEAEINLVEAATP